MGMVVDANILRDSSSTGALTDVQGPVLLLDTQAMQVVGDESLTVLLDKCTR